jgi:orotate phosphoribosyltransferase
MAVDKAKQNHIKLTNMLRELEIIHDERVPGASKVILPFYVDIKKAYGDSSIRQKIATEIWQLMDEKPNCIAASGYGGVPLATTISDLYGIKLSMIRDTPKDHGLGGFIDGYVPGIKDDVAIVDDVTTTGGSLKKVYAVIKGTGAKITGFYVAVRRTDITAEISINGFKVHYLLVPDQLF